MKINLIFIGLFLMQNIVAQTNFSFVGSGARAAGMANAFNAIADDATAISWNPAGLVQLKRPEISIVSRLTTSDYRKDYTKSPQNSFNQDIKPSLNVDYLSCILPLKINEKNFVFGLALENQLNYKYNYSDLYNDNLIKSSAVSRRNVKTLSNSVAYKFAQVVSIGLTFNYWFTQNPQYESQYDNGKGFSYTRNGKLDLTGNNFHLALMYDLSDISVPLKLGLRYSTPFKLKKLDESETQFTDNGKNSTFSYKRIGEYDMPTIIGTGISYRIGDYLTFAADYDVRPFKNKKIKDYSVYKNADGTIKYETTETNIIEANSNLNQFRVGCEYVIHPKSVLIPIRFGWKNNPTTTANYKENGDIDNQVFASSINFGYGINFKNMSIDFAFEKYWYKRSQINIYTVEKKYNYFLLSFIYYFKK